MLVAVQLPVCDLRPFLRQTGRLPVPPWPTVEADREFVRGFGAVRRRERGGVDPWLGEESYADASRALGFPNRFRPSLAIGPNQRMITACAFRRLLCGPGPTSRIEVGLRLRTMAPTGHSPMVATDPLLLWTATLPVTIGRGDRAELHPLARAGDSLARHLLRSTTRTRVKPEPDWVRAGEPLLVVDAKEGELSELPVGARAVGGLERHGLSLHHARLRTQGRTLRAWVLLGGRRSNRDVARRLRVHLLRLHAERECLRIVLRQIALGQLPVAHHDPAGDQLQWWLQNAARLLERKPGYGLPRCELLTAAQDYDDVVEPGLRASLWGQLEHVRRNVSQRLRRTVAASAREPATVYLLSPRELTMHQYNIQFGDHSVVHGDVVVAERIQASFNRAASAEADPTLKQELKVLAQEVAELTKRLPEDRGREAARDLEVFTQEALSPAPRKRWYELAAEGLLSAASTVGEVAAKVAAVVRRILTLLG